MDFSDQQSGIAAYLMSCAEREAVREGTMRNLLESDWDEPPRVQIDQGTAERKQKRQEQNARALLARAAAEWPGFILFLEDDLAFNRHLRHNLAHWYPLRRTGRDGHFFASLYNPNIRELARNDERAFFLADPDAVYGSQAFILSSATARHVVNHWDEVAGMQDIKMARLAAQVTAIYYHTPSLVQHASGPSTWGGAQHRAGDYDAEWRAVPAGETGQVRAVAIPRLPILARMRPIEGWLADNEAEALIAAVELAARDIGEDQAATIVELGSYCGKATVILGLAALAVTAGRMSLVAVDTHEGWITTLDQGRFQMGPSLEKFRRNVAAEGLAGTVRLIQSAAVDVWNQPIDLLFVDTLHDYASVAADFSHFAPWLRAGGLAVFHDYGAHFPGVQRFVDELLAGPGYSEALRAGSLIVIRKGRIGGGQYA